MGRLRARFLPPVDPAAAASDRASSRNVRAVITGATGAIARVVQISTSLITVPIVIHYLGNERFGLWMTISSVLAMASFADFGIGNGVLNHVAKAFGRDDIDGVRSAVSSGFAVLGGISVVLLVALYSTFRFIPWADVFRVSSPQARSEAGPALLVFATCFALNIPLDIVQRVQLGLQQGFRTNIWQICGSFMGLGGVILGTQLHVPLPILVLALAGAPVIATGLNSIHYFVWGRPDLRPRWSFVSTESISRIASLGGLFFILQVVVAVAFSADNFVIARTLGAAAVPEYAIPQRMFSLISILVAMGVGPLWPAYGEAIARGDISWVRDTLRRSLLLVLAVVGTASTFLLVSGPQLIRWWIGPRIHPHFALLLGLCVWTVMEGCGQALASFLNGASLMTFQITISSIFGICCLTAKIVMTHFLGVVGVPWATIVTYALIIALPLYFYIPGALRRLEGNPNPLNVGAEAGFP